RIEQRPGPGEDEHRGGGDEPGHRVLHANMRAAHADEHDHDQYEAERSGDVQEAVHLFSISSSAGTGCRTGSPYGPVKPAIEFEHVDEDSEKHVHDIVQRP